jgi:hypothetical protein
MVIEPLENTLCYPCGSYTCKHIGNDVVSSPGCLARLKLIFSRVSAGKDTSQQNHIGACNICLYGAKIERPLEQFNLDYLEDTMNTTAAAQFVISQVCLADSMMATRLANAPNWSEDVCHGYWLDEGPWPNAFVATSRSALLGSSTCALHLPINVAWACLRGLSRSLLQRDQPPSGGEVSDRRFIKVHWIARRDSSFSFLSAIACPYEMSLTSQRASSRFRLATLRHLWYLLLLCAR